MQTGERTSLPESWDRQYSYLLSLTLQHISIAHWWCGYEGQKQGCSKETHRQTVPWARDTHLLSQRDVRASLCGHGTNLPHSLLSSPRFYLHSLGKRYVAMSSTHWCLIKTSRISRASCLSRDTLCLIYLVNCGYLVLVALNI